jgi:hypothetical protein
MQKLNLLALMIIAVLLIPTFSHAFCGDGIIEDAERCDGANLNNMTCENLDVGYIGGELSCTLDCNYNVRKCVPGPPEEENKPQAKPGTPQERPYCGDSIVEGNEKCDSSNLNNNTCDSLGYNGGTLACTNGCVFDLSLCGQLINTNPTTPDLVQKDNEGNIIRTIGELAMEYGPLGVVAVLIIFVIYMVLITRTTAEQEKKEILEELESKRYK